MKEYDIQVALIQETHTGDEIHVIFSAKLDFIEILEETGMPQLKKYHSIYFDVQEQLHICKKRICLFYVWKLMENRIHLQIQIV